MAAPEENAYALLGLENGPAATEAEIKKVGRQASRGGCRGSAAHRRRLSPPPLPAAPPAPPALSTPNSCLTLSLHTPCPQTYRKLALLKHPDKNPDNPRAADEFAALQKAYDVLCDAEARAALDALFRCAAPLLSMLLLSMPLRPHCRRMHRIPVGPAFSSPVATSACLPARPPAGSRRRVRSAWRARTRSGGA